MIEKIRVSVSYNNKVQSNEKNKLLAEKQEMASSFLHQI
jgi:hypothetical protein